MIELKNNKVRIRCLECKTEHFIEMKLIGSEKEQRSLGYEYEHIYRGDLKCSHCSDKMSLLCEIYEYPKGFLNYHHFSNKGCLEMDNLKEDIFNITE